MNKNFNKINYFYFLEIGIWTLLGEFLKNYKSNKKDAVGLFVDYKWHIIIIYFNFGSIYGLLGNIT